MPWGSVSSDRESFTVDAGRERADLWRAAAAERSTSVASWLADTADAHLRELARTGRATPLLWDRGRFLVRLTDTSRNPSVAADVEVPGLVSRPFGIFRGCGRGVGIAGERHAHARPPPNRADPRHPFPAEELHGAGGRAGAPGDRLAGDGPGAGARGRAGPGEGASGHPAVRKAHLRT